MNRIGIFVLLFMMCFTLVSCRRAIEAMKSVKRSVTKKIMPGKKEPGKRYYPDASHSMKQKASSTEAYDDAYNLFRLWVESLLGSLDDGIRTKQIKCAKFSMIQINRLAEVAPSDIAKVIKSYIKIFIPLFSRVSDTDTYIQRRVLIRKITREYRRFLKDVPSHL